MNQNFITVMKFVHNFIDTNHRLKRGFGYFWSKWELVLGGCGVLTRAGCIESTKAALPRPSAAGQGKENIMTGSKVEIRTDRHHSLITAMSKTGYN